MNSTQFAWLYLIENGLAGVTPSYYGGYDPVETNRGSRKFYSKEDVISTNNAKYIRDIERYGVDWNKTSAPTSSFVSEFQGTLCDSKSVECLKGTFVLNNGVKQTWFAEAIPVVDVFDMLSKVDLMKDRFYKIFGE